MAIAKKGSRQIRVDGKLYVWRLGRPNDLGFPVVVARMGADGSVLRPYLRFALPLGTTPSPAVIRQVVLAASWDEKSPMLTPAEMLAHISAAHASKDAMTVAVPAGVHKELERHIADTPDDDDAWQVYADALIESGRDWGFHIRQALQGTHAKEREARILRVEKHAKLSQLILQWQRGAIIYAESRESVTCEVGSAQVRNLRACEEARFLQSLSLDVGGTRETKGMMELITASPWRSLHTLQIIGHVGIVDVSDPEIFPNLRSLALHGYTLRLRALRLPKLSLLSIGDVNDADLEVLASSLSSLRHLRLGGRELSRAALEKLLRSPSLGQLNALGIVQPQRASDVIHWLATLPVAQHVERLEVFALDARVSPALANLRAQLPQLAHIHCNHVHEDFARATLELAAMGIKLTTGFSRDVLRSLNAWDLS